MGRAHPTHPPTYRRFRQIKRTLKRYDDLAVEACVGFILAPAHVYWLSWGTITFFVDGVKKLFPKTTRKKTLTNMHKGTAPLALPDAGPHITRTCANPTFSAV